MMLFLLYKKYCIHPQLHKFYRIRYRGQPGGRPRRSGEPPSAWDSAGDLAQERDLLLDVDLEGRRHVRREVTAGVTPHADVAPAARGRAPAGGVVASSSATCTSTGTSMRRTARPGGSARSAARTGGDAVVELGALGLPARRTRRPQAFGERGLARTTGGRQVVRQAPRQDCADVAQRARAEPSGLRRGVQGHRGRAADVRHLGPPRRRAAGRRGRARGRRRARSPEHGRCAAGSGQVRVQATAEVQSSC